MKKGSKMSQESIQKMSLSHRGVLHTEETKAKISHALSRCKRTEEHKQKIREYRLGKKASEKTKKKMSLQRIGNKYSLGKNSGALCHFWKGGVTPTNKVIRNSFEYKRWRTLVFQRDDFTCQSCGVKGVMLHADHELPFAYFPDLRFEVLNGQTLCINCHKNTPTYGERGKRLAIELGWAETTKPTRNYQQPAYERTGLE